MSAVRSTGRRAETALNEIVRKIDGPLVVILAGHNGSGKSTFWFERLANKVKIPLLNADRMMLSFLPDVRQDRPLPYWAVQIRDMNRVWMSIVQKSVESAIQHAASCKVAFGTETVFSHWMVLSDGTVQSKADLIRKLQHAGYFVILVFVGLASANLSIGRVAARVQRGGHAVEPARLVERFSRTQTAIRNALNIADASILCDNSRSIEFAFTTVQVRTKDKILFDMREGAGAPPLISRWLDVVAPHV